MSSNHIFARALRMAKQDAEAGTPLAPKTHRRFAQPKVDPLVFVSLGPENAVPPSNARTKGPVLQGIRRLTAGQSLKVIFKLPGFDGWIKATAKVVWLNSAGTAAGLQFVDIPGESRRLVDNWLSIREQNGGVGAVPGSPAAPSTNAALPNARELDLDSYQVALPVEAIEVIPGPQSFRPALLQAAVQSSSRSGAPAVENKFAKTAAAPQSQGSASLPAAVQLGTPLESFKDQVRSTQPFSLALAALIGMFAVGGLIFWHSQGELSRRSVSAQLAQSEVPVEAAALPEAPIETSQNSAATPRSEPVAAPVLASAVPSATDAQSAAKPEKLKPLTQATPNNLAATRHFEASPPPARQVVRATPPSAPILPRANSQPTAAVSAPAPAAAASTTSTRSISERPPEPTIPAAPSEKAASPVAAPTVSAENATGSVEVISDPYPSIRTPSDANSRALRPVALTIGHLISKVEPVYPPEALGERISGTVKLHILRGLDGRVETASVTDGPAPLREAALQAVQQWLYEPTLLGSTPVKAEEDVAIVFRVTTPAHSAN